MVLIWDYPPTYTLTDDFTGTEERAILVVGLLVSSFWTREGKRKEVGSGTVSGVSIISWSDRCCRSFNRGSCFSSVWSCDRG